MAITALLFFCLSLFLFRALYLALLKQGQERDENRATKRLKSCDSEERAEASKKSQTQDEEEEEDEADLQFPATKLQRQLQQRAPFSGPDSGVGSSSNCEGSSSSKKKFEVFISHRGPDTKQTLAYHMYDLLCDRGVEVFLDKEELQSGERFPLAIEEAIKCSTVDVCILSSGFAESVWCLKELEIMVNKYEMGRSKLIPIFYDVKPCDVRHLQGAFGQGFQTKIIDKNRYPTQLIDKWRQSLRKIADITGEEGKGECCKAIVNKILQELDVGLLDVSSNIVGRQKELLNLKHDIMKCCHNECGVTSVEISGMGGIGKTTFAKQLYNLIFPQYERCCFIEDVGGLVEKYGVNEVYKQLIRSLLRYDPSNSKMEGKKLLKIRLKDAKILVVFDNIHSKIPLSKVFIEDDVSLDPSSIIIVTTREKDVLKHDPRVALYCKNLISLQLSNLDFNNSNKLFCQYAFGETDNVMNEFDELKKSIIEKCHGIPLALTLLGSQLYKREIKIWKNLWNSLKCYLHHDLKKILKISYDNLDTELEKCLFLDVATIFLLEKEDLLVQLRQCNDENGESEVLQALDELKRKNLIKVVGGVLMMHDLLIDLGRSIVKDEDSCPGHRSRVWHPSDVREMLSDDETGTNKVKALSLVFRGSAVLNDGCPWPTDAFRKLSSLEFLILQGPCMEGDLSKLSKRLSWLKWTDFPYEDIPERLCLKHMKVLQLSGQWLTSLWKHHTKEDALMNLRRLSLSNCMNLKRLPEFMAKFRHLSSIELKGCTSLESIPDSFDQLQALQHLQLMYCFKIKTLPESFGKLLQLRELSINWCIALKCLPESFGTLSRLETLEMESCKALQYLPESFGTLSRLKTLNMRRCQALQCLPESFGTLSRLETLVMNECSTLQCLPESFGTLSRLKTLNMWRCQALQCLSESFGTLSRLETLEMIECSTLQCLPDSFGTLSRLETLRMNTCSTLQCLPESFGTLSRLETLNMNECSTLQCLPESFGTLSRLKTLNMENCEALQCLPESFGKLSRLETLNMENCEALQCLPESFGKLLWLRGLNMTRCIALKCLPESFGHLQQLKNFYLTNCHGLEELPESFGDLMMNLCTLVFGGHKVRLSLEQVQRLQRIRYLSISGYEDNMEIAYSSCGKTSGTEQQNIGCWKNSNYYGQATQQQHLTSLVHSQYPGGKTQNRAAAVLFSDINVHAPPQLHDVELVELISSHLLSWYESGSHMRQQVQQLSLQGLWNLRELPQCVANLGHLKVLRLRGCASLEWLPDTMANLQNLRELEIIDCIVLKGLPSWLGNISSLTTLAVNDCWMVEVIHVQELVNLRALQVIGCVNLRSIIGLSGLPKLSKLMIEGCLNLRDLAITRRCAAFNSLEWLSICGCYQLCLPSVEHIPPDQLYYLKLSLNHDSLEPTLDEGNQTLPNILQWSSHAMTTERVLNAKTSPLLFSAVEKRVRDLLSTKDDSSYSFFNQVSHDAHPPSEDDNFDSSYSFFNKLSHVPRKDGIVAAAVWCFVSAAHAVDFPLHIPPPHTTFSTAYAFSRHSLSSRFDFGEEIHIATCRVNLTRSCELRIEKARDCRESYEALVKEGWLIWLDGRWDRRGLLTEIYNIFCSEVMKQRWLSRAWTELPSQLCISEFSALDIANCQITKTSRHFNTYIMEEESGLTWKRRRCLFMDDHALLLENPRKNSGKHGFLAYTRLRKNSSNHGVLADLPYTGLHLDLEAGVVANLYEMSISVSGKGKLNSRKLQEIVSINEQEIPVALNTLLRTNASDSTLAALHKKKMNMRVNLSVSFQSRHMQ